MRKYIVARLAAILFASILFGCAAPPYMLPKAPSTPVESPSEGQAKVVVMRPFMLGETGGHYVVVDETGHMHGTLISSSSLETSLPAGKHILFAWNPRREEQHRVELADIAVLPMQLDPGKIYYALLGFRLLIEPTQREKYNAKRMHWYPSPVAGEAEFHPLGPQRRYWDRFPTWLQDCNPFVIDPEQAGYWEATNPNQIRDHIEWGLTRLNRFSEIELQLRTLEATDGFAPGTGLEMLGPHDPPR